jgi:hypothetical protein
MHPLGCPSGTIGCGALGINGRGDIVGHAYRLATGLSAAAGEAFIHRDGVFYRLDDLAQGAVGWHLEIASSINDAGQIVGTGSIDGASHGFLLTPR